MSDTLTYSRQAAFKTCRKKHQFAYEHGLRREIDAKALRIGSAGHAALEILLRGESLEQAVTALYDRYHVTPDNVEPYDWQIEKHTVLELVNGWYWRWLTDVEFSVIAAEQVFELPLVNPDTGSSSRNFTLAGMIDGIIEIDGHVGVMEHKFLSEDLSSDSTLWQRLDFDHQISLYLYAARQLGYQAEFVLYDVIRKPGIRPESVPILDEEGLRIVLDGNGDRVLTKQGKPRQTASTADGYVLQTRQMTPDEYAEKLREDIYVRPDYYYCQREIGRLDDEIRECMTEMWEIQQTLRDAQRNGRWYRTVDKGTCSWCEYFGLCQSKFDPMTGVVPEGFQKLENVNPELAR